MNPEPLWYGKKWPRCDRCGRMIMLDWEYRNGQLLCVHCIQADEDADLYD